jgi:hypothetical protein
MKHAACSKQVYSSTLKMEVTCSSKMSDESQQTTPCYIPENRTLHKYQCEHFKFYMVTKFICFIFAHCVKSIRDITVAFSQCPSLVLPKYLKHCSFMNIHSVCLIGIMTFILTYTSYKKVKIKFVPAPKLKVTV